MRQPDTCQTALLWGTLEDNPRGLRAHRPVAVNHWEASYAPLARAVTGSADTGSYQSGTAAPAWSDARSGSGGVAGRRDLGLDYLCRRHRAPAFGTRQHPWLVSSSAADRPLATRPLPRLLLGLPVCDGVRHCARFCRGRALALLAQVVRMDGARCLALLGDLGGELVFR